MTLQVFTLARLFQLEEAYAGEFSSIARMGSGSACRSLYGGFVKWVPGESADGRDSIAVQVLPFHHSLLVGISTFCVVC